MGSFFENCIFLPILFYHICSIFFLLEGNYSHPGYFLSFYLDQLVPVVAIFTQVKILCM